MDSDDSCVSDDSDVDVFQRASSENYGSRPYMFEPRVSCAARNSSEGAGDTATNTPTEPEVERDDVPDVWCSCGECRQPNDASNRFCCREEEAYIRRLADGIRESTPSEAKCITHHASFSAVCLNVDVLRVAYFQMRQSGHCTEQTDESMRYTAYRQLVRWCYGWLGKYNRKPLPSCVMHKIREQFPSTTYAGFKFADRQ